MERYRHVDASSTVELESSMEVTISELHGGKTLAPSLSFSLFSSAFSTTSLLSLSRVSFMARGTREARSNWRSKTGLARKGIDPCVAEQIEETKSMWNGQMIAAAAVDSKSQCTRLRRVARIEYGPGVRPETFPCKDAAYASFDEK